MIIGCSFGLSPRLNKDIHSPVPLNDSTRSLAQSNIKTEAVNRESEFLGMAFYIVLREIYYPFMSGHDIATDGSDLMSLLSKTDAASSTLFVLLDLNMPKKTGREALKEIKEDPALKKIPVIVFTTAKNETEIRKCYDLGANTYIVKPDSLEDLRKVVSNLNSYWLDTAATPS